MDIPTSSCRALPCLANSRSHTEHVCWSLLGHWFSTPVCPSEAQLASSNMASEEEYDRMASTREKRGCMGSIQRSIHPSILSQRIITLTLTERHNKGNAYRNFSRRLLPSTAFYSSMICSSEAILFATKLQWNSLPPTAVFLVTHLSFQHLQSFPQLTTSAFVHSAPTTSH